MRIIVKKHLLLFTLILFMGLNQVGWGQTPYVMSSGNYSENFADIANWTNNFTAGTGASSWGAVAINATGAIPDGIKTTKSSATWVTSTTGGIQKGTQAFQFLSTGSTLNANSVAVDLLLDFTGRIAGTLSFDWAAIDNASGTRPTSLRVYWSVDGTTFTEITTAQILDQVSPTTGTISTISLPSNFNNSATARIRYYNYAGTVAGSGNRDKMQIDNIAVTSTPSATPTIALSSPSQTSSGNINQGATDQILSHFQADVTVANATLNSISFTSAGTYTATDINNFKVYYASSDVFGSATSLGTISTSLGTGAHSLSSLTQSISSDAIGYFWITCDVAALGTALNTINIAADPTLTFEAGTPTGTISVGGTQTIQEVIPDIALSSPNPAVAIGNITENTTNNVIYRFDLAVTTANATISGLQITTAGTYVATDLTNIKAWYSSDNTFSSGSDVLLSTKSSALDAGTQVFSGWTNQVINSGTTGYIFITTDVPCGATIGNTISVSAVATSDFTFLSGNKSGSSFAGGEQTIQLASASDVSTPSATSGNAQVTLTWTNPTSCYSEILIIAKASSSVTGTPSGDGSLYTANLVYATPGTELGDGYVVYKGSTSSQIVNGLTNGTTYYFKYFTRNGTNWSTGTEVSATPIIPASATVTLRPSYIDISSATSESAVLMTLSNYSSNDAKYRLYASGQYYCWDAVSSTYITSSTYSAGPSVIGTPTTSSTFWIPFQAGSNLTTSASYRDRLGAGYASNYQTAALPAATAVSSAFNLTGTVSTGGGNDLSVKYVVLGFDAVTDGTLLFATSSALTTGTYTLVCGNAQTVKRVEVRTITNTILNSTTNSGGWTSTTDLGDMPLPVELTSFSASAQNKTVNLTWQTATEVNNYGFEVERVKDFGDKVSMVSVWEKVGFVYGAGNSNSPKEYSFTDKSATSGKYLYRLKQLDNDGQYTYSKEVQVDLGTPTAFALEQNYPNPFNPTTSMQYSVSNKQFVTIKVFDMLGREVAILVNGEKEPGTYTAEFATTGLASGTYIYRMQAGEFVQTKKMVILK